jgi:HK97 family phage portal protein
MNIFGYDLSLRKQQRDAVFVEGRYDNEFEVALAKWDMVRSSLANTWRCAVPPVDPYVISALSRVSGYHSNALHLKVAVSVGQGYECSDALREHIEYANEDQTFDDLLYELAYDLENYGNAYVEVVRDRRSAAFYRSNALTTRIRPTGVGDEKQFIAFAPELNGSIEAIAFDDYRYSMTRGMRTISLPRLNAERWYGSPEWISARRALTTNLSIVTLAEKWFDNGLFLDKLIVVKGGNLTTEQKKSLRQFISRTMKGVDNANKSLLIELARQAELDIKDLSVNVKENSFGATRAENVIEIAAAHLLPSAKLIGVPSAGQLGASDEVDALVRFFAMTFGRQRQRKWNAFIRRLLRDARLPDADSFSLIPLDTTAGTKDAQMLAQATAGAPWLTPEEARDEWFADTEKFTPQAAASFVRFLNTIEKTRKKL